MVACLQASAFGQTGLTVAKLSLGTVKFGRKEGLKYPHPVSLPDDRAAQTLLDGARDLGITLLDTAPAYGSSERRLGQLLKGQHQHWQICTKVGEEFTAGQSHFDFTPEHCRYSIERSLRHLQRDCIDIALIHSDGNDLDILQHYGTLDALKELRSARKIRAVGMSHKTLAGGQLALKQGVDVLMATLNTDYTLETDLISQAADMGVGVLIKKALNSGHANPKDLSWIAQHQGVSSLVVGTTNLTHLRANADLVG